MKSKFFSGDIATGTHLTMLPGDATSAPKDVWKFEINREGKKPGAFTNSPTGFLPVYFDPTSRLFTVRLTRAAGEKPGWNWHLLDANGNRWRFPGRDNGAYVSPYEIAGFADSGKKIVAYDSSRLFALPVSSIMVNENEAK
jgi:hypothetical protein